LRCLALVGLLLIAVATASTQPVVTVRGIVKSQATGEAIRFVTVSELATRSRVMTDRDGEFSFRISSSRLDSLNTRSLHLVFSCIGYRRDTIVIPAQDTTLNIELHERGLLKSEVVVVAEDPAVGIIRAVIARKRRQLERLQTYTYTLYTKFIASTDTTTAMRSSGHGDTVVYSILESFSRGYVALPDNCHNEIFQRRQTVNVPPEANFVSFGTNLNIFDESVTIIGEEIASPLATDAIDVYDYKLISSQDDDTVEIEVRPRSSLRRGFTGSIFVDQRRAIPLEVRLTPSKAVNLPFDARLSYRQNLMLVDSMVVPEALSITSTLDANILYVVSPRLDIDIETFCYDYVINPSIDRSIFDRRRVETTSNASTFDSLYWQTNLRLPLLPDEERAYREIEMMLENPDSLQRSMFDRILGPVSRFLQRLGRPPFTGFDDIFRYNLIHGPYLGIGLRQRVDTSLVVLSTLGYGLSDKRLYPIVGASWHPDDAQRLTLLTTIGRSLMRRDDPTMVIQSLITFTSLLDGSDYGDYYLSTGFNISASYSWGQLRFVRGDLWMRPNTLAITYYNAIEKSVSQTTNWALLGPSTNQRPNPTIEDGRMSSLSSDVFLSFSPLRRFSRTGMALSFEASDRSILQSDFEFARVSWLGFARLKTMPLWTLDLTANVRWGWGAVPPQRFVSSESGIGGLVAGTAFRGMRVKEFYGDRLLSLQFNHNFGEVIPGLLRIPNIASFGIEFLIFGGVQWTSFSPQTRSTYPTHLPSTDDTADKTYFEVGLGVNRLLLFLRVDFNVRLAQRDVPELRVTLTNATF
jgi:hypothetical protein